MSRISLSERSDPTTTRWQQVYLGVAFTTVGALLLELSLTRIFSVVFYYHFAFLAISIALFGLGAGGILSYVVAGWRRPLYGKLGGLSAAVALLIPAALVFALSLRSEPTGLTLAAVYFVAALPFMGAGAIISLVISATMERVDRVYFFDLIGAAAGCLLLVPFLNVFGGPNTVLAAAVFFSAAAAIWWNIARNPVGRAAAVALSLALVALMTYNQQRPVLDVAFAKGMKLGPERFVKWNSFSRISVGPEPGSDRQRIVIDADAATGIPDFDLDRLTEEQQRALLKQGPALPYLLRPGAKTLIIGPGGGWDVARAVATGSRDITGVEINPIIAETVMRGRLADLSRRLYFRPEVRIVVEDGRSFLRRTGDQYQVIQATLVDTWASTAAGAFALSENNLYTTEAFVDYLKHLRQDGVFGMTRWGFEPPRESVRVLALARAALEQMGEREAWRHVAVGREGSVQGWGAQDTILLFRRPVEDVEKVRAAISTAGLEKVYLPGDTGSPFAEVLRTKNLTGFYQSYRYDISPVGDDRPFFFYTVQPRDLWNFLAAGQQDSADYKINKAIPLLFGLMGISLAATLIVLALPPLLLGARLPVQTGVRTFLLYFLAIGVGYILIQVALIQKFVLFLGHPTYALTVVVFSMLVASGMGSYFSRRWVASKDTRLVRVLAGIAMLVVALALVSGPVTTLGVGWPLAVKFAVTVALIAPAAFLMGMPFPNGLARLEATSPESVRWAWALNAAASVLGSAGAIFLAIYSGLQATLFAGGLLYLGALIVVGYSSNQFQEWAKR